MTLTKGRVLGSGLRVTSLCLCSLLASKSGEDSGGHSASCCPKAWSKKSQGQNVDNRGGQRERREVIEEGGERAEEGREGCNGTSREAEDGQGAGGLGKRGE